MGSIVIVNGTTIRLPDAPYIAEKKLMDEHGARPYLEEHIGKQFTEAEWREYLMSPLVVIAD